MKDTAGEVQAALEDCVVYKVNGTYRQMASGLSCYYSYNGAAWGSTHLAR